MEVAFGIQLYDYEVHFQNEIMGVDLEFFPHHFCYKENESSTTVSDAPSKCFYKTYCKQDFASSLTISKYFGARYFSMVQDSFI